MTETNHLKSDSVTSALLGLSNANRFSHFTRQRWNVVASLKIGFLQLQVAPKSFNFFFSSPLRSEAACDNQTKVFLGAFLRWKLFSYSSSRKLCFTLPRLVLSMAPSPPLSLPLPLPPAQSSIQFHRCENQTKQFAPLCFLNSNNPKGAQKWSSFLRILVEARILFPIWFIACVIQQSASVYCYFCLTIWC